MLIKRVLLLLLCSWILSAPALAQDSDEPDAEETIASQSGEPASL